MGRGSNLWCRKETEEEDQNGHLGESEGDEMEDVDRIK
jgi:hypothetical protein